MNRFNPRPLDYAPKQPRSSSAIDATEIVLWVIWAMMLAFFVLLIVV